MGRFWTYVEIRLYWTSNNSSSNLYWSLPSSNLSFTTSSSDNRATPSCNRPKGLVFIHNISFKILFAYLGGLGNILSWLYVSESRRIVLLWYLWCQIELISSHVLFFLFFLQYKREKKKQLTNQFPLNIYHYKTSWKKKL